ncbi:MAG: protein phosphatase 2C domain-containing protein [Deltaproteobacteria bacterium]|nr:protein phosphatase 2C domain-containing protein [Deltaproteobacteria bacterium]
MRAGLQLGNASDVGRERQANEDYFGYAEPEEDDAWRRKGRLLIVSDGMGGAAGGAVASRLVVDRICAGYLAESAADPLDALRSAIEAANDHVYERAQQDPELRGMGATATAVAIVGGTAYVAHVGDTRAYLVRRGQIVQLTEDQSLVARMVREGVITPTEAKDHPKSNVIEQAVGQKPTVLVDTSIPPQRLEPGDAIVLCTDGLHGLVSAAEIARFVTAFAPGEAAKILVDLANGRGGPDNITVQIARVGSPNGVFGALPGGGNGSGGESSHGWRVLPAAGIASLVLAAAVGGLLVFVLGRRGNGQADATDCGATGPGAVVASASDTETSNGGDAGTAYGLDSGSTQGPDGGLAGACDCGPPTCPEVAETAGREADDDGTLPPGDAVREAKDPPSDHQASASADDEVTDDVPSDLAEPLPPDAGSAEEVPSQQGSSRDAPAADGDAATPSAGNDAGARDRDTAGRHDAARPADARPRRGEAAAVRPEADDAGPHPPGESR